MLGGTKARVDPSQDEAAACRIVVGSIDPQRKAWNISILSGSKCHDGFFAIDGMINCTTVLPIILYSLISGRSGTNKSSCISLLRSIIQSLRTLDDGHDKQHIFDSGTIEGLMSTLNENNGSVLCAVDEFSSFLDAMDKNSNGNVERSRYLSLWSGSTWSKKTKHGGHIQITEPRFQFVGFNQNYFLLNMVMNNNHFDGFLPRFLVATPKEEYITLKEKVDAAKSECQIDMQSVFNRIFQTFFNSGYTFNLDEESLQLFSSYHDNDVLEFRKADVFEDVKSMIKSKSVGNVLRVAGIQCALRAAIKNTEIDKTDLVIIKEDMERALVLVKYSLECLFSLIDTTKESSKTGKKRYLEMPDPLTMDSEFLSLHKSKIQKIFNQGTVEVPVSTITRNHLCPQIGGKTNADDVRKFLKGLELNGLGELKNDTKEKAVFKLVDKENTNDPKTVNLIKKLDL